VRDVVQRYYLGVTRYTTSAFLRAQLGGALRERDLAPQLYETAIEAAARLDHSKGN
jgi:propionate CoA-transferase